MTYTLNIPGIPFLGFSSTIFNQFNGYLQLNDLNKLVGGAYERTLNGPETNSK